MLNAVGREIPEEILERTGKEVFQGNNYKDGKAFQKASPKVTPVMRNDHDKMVKDIHEALVKCNAHDGMTVSFHHHFREGDLVVCMVMEEIHKMGFKNITLSASSLGKAHDALVPMIEDGTIVNIESSGVRGKIGDAISHGKLKGLATMRSHGGRVRAIETGETHVDIAFIGAPSCDEYGNCSGMGGKTNCGVLSYAYVDAEMADYVVAVTDCLVDYPNYPAEINQTKVDYVCVVDQIGIPEKIATGAAKPTTDQRKILMAEYCTQVVANTPYFKDGFSYQTGVGGASIASTISLSKIMEEKNIHMGLGVGGLTKPMCELLDRGLARKLVDTQDFDLDAVNNVRTNPNHFPISAGEYASPMNKGAFVNKLDYVILASLEVDTHFNCNVVVGSDGIITGAQGGDRTGCKMHHRHRSSAAGPHPGHLHRRDHRHHPGRERGHRRYRLRRGRQPPPSRSAEGPAGRRLRAAEDHRGAARHRLLHRRRAGEGPVRRPHRGHHRGPRRHCHGRRPRSQAFLFPRRLSDIA